MKIQGFMPDIIEFHLVLCGKRNWNCLIENWESQGQPRGLRLISCLRESKTLFCRIIWLLTLGGRRLESKEGLNFRGKRRIYLFWINSSTPPSMYWPCHMQTLEVPLWALSPTALSFEKSGMGLLRGKEYLGSSVSSAPTENNRF